MVTNGFLLSALGFVAGVGLAEHDYSATMSSPWSVDKFVIDQDDADKVMRLFWMTAAISIGYGIIISYLIGNWWALAGAIMVVILMYYLYSQAIDHQL